MALFNYLAHEFEDEVGVVFIVGVRLWLVEIFDVGDSCLGDVVGLDGWANGAGLNNLAIVVVEVTSFEGYANAVVRAEGLDERRGSRDDGVGGTVVW